MLGDYCRVRIKEYRWALAQPIITMNETVKNESSSNLYIKVTHDCFGIVLYMRNIFHSWMRNMRDLQIFFYDEANKD